MTSLQIFTRILRSFQLPVGSKELQTGAHKEYLDASKAATLIVSLLVGSMPSHVMCCGTC